DMHLGDQRAGGVKHAQAALLGLFAHRERHAVGGEDHRVARRHLVQFVDEDRALVTQVVDDELVVHDFVAHVDRRAEALQCALDDLDCALDAGAEAARVGQQDFLVAHGGGSLSCAVRSAQTTPMTSTSKWMCLPASGWLKSISADLSSISRTSPE